MNRAISQRKQRGAVGDEWETPWQVFQFIEKKLGVTFTLDACATNRNAKCARYSSLDLQISPERWKDHEIVFCNPPYSDISKWLGLMEYGSRVQACMCVVLIKAGTGTKWFHKYVPLAHDVAFLMPRVNYIPPKGVKASSPFHGSMVLVFKPGRKKIHKPKFHFWKWK